MKHFFQSGRMGLIGLVMVASAAAQGMGELDGGTEVVDLMGANCKHSATRFNCVEYVGNYDGDTLTFDVADVHPLLGKDMKVRVHGIDTAEIRSDDACEREVAAKTQQMVQELISGANRVDLVNVAREKYFRVLADVMVDNRSLAEYLLRKGLAIRYDGGTKPDVNWCRVR